MRIIGVTSCPTGIAHTYMSAEALKIAANELEYDIKIETQGALGIENELNEDDIKYADIVIIASDKGIDESRFVKKQIFHTSTQDAIKDAKKVINDAINSKSFNTIKKTKLVKFQDEVKSIYKHLLTGISAMVPFLIVGSVLYGISSAALNFKPYDIKEFASVLRLISNVAISLALPVLSTYIALSIGNIPALAPGLVSGFMVSYLNGGFISAIITGLLTGAIVNIIKNNIRIYKELEGLKNAVILPVLSVLAVGMIYMIILIRPLDYIDRIFYTYTYEIKGIIGYILGITIAVLVAYDMGGPINKLAYLIGVGTVSMGKSSVIMAVVMAAGMVPPLAVGLVSQIMRKSYSPSEMKFGISAIVKGSAFITEGAMPFAQKEPKVVMPAIICGSALTGLLVVAFKCSTTIPHGGMFSLLIPGLIQNPLYFVLAIVLGVILSSIIMIYLKMKK